MKVTDYSPTVISLWSTWETFRRLGFDSDEISFEAHPTDGAPIALFVILRSQGKTFTVTVEKFDSEDVVQEHYNSFLDFSRRLNAGEFSENVLGKMYRCHQPHDMLVSLVIAMTDKGFVLEGELGKLAARLGPPMGEA